MIALTGAFVLLLTALMIVCGGIYNPFAFTGGKTRQAVYFVLGLLLTIWTLVWFILGIRMEL